MQDEGTYDTIVSGWNELDGWVASDKVTFEVLAMAGPIEIDDFAIIRDVVRNLNPQTERATSV